VITDLPIKHFKRYHSDKHFSELYLQNGGKNQLAQIGNKNTFTVIQCLGLQTVYWILAASKGWIKQT